MASGKGPVTAELSRDLSLFHITMMGLGMMIGAGVFIGVGNTIHVVGPGGLLLTFALNGVIAMFTAMSYAELCSAVPRAGGAYNFARMAFGRGPSFVAGWMEWFASSVAGSLYAVTLAIYTTRYLEQLLGWSWLSESVAIKGVAMLAACFFLYTNYRGASETGKIGAFFTLGQMLFLVFIGIVGVVVAIHDPSRLANFDPFLPKGWERLLVTMGFTYVAFEGFEVIAQAGDEAIDPRRNLPKAMLYSVFFVTLTYVVVAFATVVSVGEIPPELRAQLPAHVDEVWEWIGHYRERGFGEAVGRLMPAANLLLTLAVIFAATSALNATIYSATRASYALGRDRMLPEIFAKISSRRNTPWFALLATGGIVIVVATLLPTMDVASSASIMFLFLFFLVNVCVIRIRVNMGDELRYGFLMPWFPVFPLLAIVCQATLAVWLVHMSLVAWIVAPVWIAMGVAVYYLYGRSHAITTEEEIQVVEERQAPAGDGYRVMVTVANPDNAVELIGNTYKLCGAKQARVEVLHMVPVPDQVPLSDAKDHMTAGRESIIEVMMALSLQFPASSTLRYCRNIARGIISAVREKKIDMLIMGWHGQPSGRTFSLGSTVDPIIERTPCNVVVLKDCGGNRLFTRVLVPLAGGPNGALALEIAGILADPEEGEVTALTIHRPGSVVFDVAAFVEEHRSRIALPADRVHTKSVGADNVVGGIIAASHDYDLVVLGCSREPLLRQVGRTSVPERIASICVKPVVMVKASSGLRSMVKRWI